MRVNGRIIKGNSGYFFNGIFRFGLALVEYFESTELSHDFASGIGVGLSTYAAMNHKCDPNRSIGFSTNSQSTS